MTLCGRACRSSRAVACGPSICAIIRTKAKPAQPEVYVLDLTQGLCPPMLRLSTYKGGLEGFLHSRTLSEERTEYGDRSGHVALIVRLALLISCGRFCC